MANSNDFMKKYYEIMDGLTENEKKLSKKAEESKEEEEKDDNDEIDAEVNNILHSLALNRAYHKKYNNETNNASPIIEKFLDKVFPGHKNNYGTSFVNGEFIKALSDIATKDGDMIRIGYALSILQKEAENILPFNPIEYRNNVKLLDNVIDEIIYYGINNLNIKINDKNIEKLIAKYKKYVNHSEAAMEAEEEEKSKEVEKETTKDKKEEDKKKKEEKKKKNEENRNVAKKWFDYDSIDALNKELKNNKPVWYRIANRIAALLVQEEVQKVIGNEKFKLLIYQGADDFAIINETNTRIFWFKEKSNVDHFTDTNMFNIKWAEAHQADQLKFTA